MTGRVSVRRYSRSMGVFAPQDEDTVFRAAPGTAASRRRVVPEGYVLPDNPVFDPW